MNCVGYASSYFDRSTSTWPSTIFSGSDRSVTSGVLGARAGRGELEPSLPLLLLALNADTSDLTPLMALSFSLPLLRRSARGFLPGTIVLLFLFGLFHYLPFGPSSSSRPSLSDVSFDPLPSNAYNGENPFLPIDANGAPIPFEHPSKSTTKLKPPRIVKDAAKLAHPDLPPDFPDPDSLPKPSDFARFLEMGGRKIWKGKEPNVTVFPDELLKHIRPEGISWGELARGGNWSTEHGTFAREWEDNEMGEPQREMPKVQFQDWAAESGGERELREGRRDVVKGAFL